MIDEARISDNARSEGWLKACFNNQVNPSGFYSIGDIEARLGYPPILKGERPFDDAVDVSVNQATINVTIEDPEGDDINWTIEGEYVTNAGVNEDSNGSKSANLITPLPYDTEIIWYVNSTDSGSGSWANASYSFTTEMGAITWWNDGWNYRRMITINHSEVTASFSNFPVLIDFQNDSIGSYLSLIHI